MTVAWQWVARHGRAVSWASACGAVLLLIAGVALGVGHGSRPQTGLQESALLGQPVAARVPASRHSVVGVIRAVGPSEILVRNRRGMFFAVRWGAGAHFRAAGREIRPAALRPGNDVVVIGNPAIDGSMIASYVTVVAGPAAAEPAGGGSVP